jgi:hypothetical protein
MTLPPDVMAGLVRILFHGHATWEAEDDVLRPAMREPATPLGAHPPSARLSAATPVSQKARTCRTRLEAWVG